MTQKGGHSDCHTPKEGHVPRCIHLTHGTLVLSEGDVPYIKEPGLDSPVRPVDGK